MVSISMAAGHVHHRARFGDRALAGIELDLDELHVVAVDLVVNLVCHIRCQVSGVQVSGVRLRSTRESPQPSASPAPA